MVIAIDGPAGAGKSTVARAVAATLGYTYMDSGAMYRATALAVLDCGIEPTAGAAKVDVTPDGRIRVDAVDVTDRIREPKVTAAASGVARDPAVRAALVDKQRELIAAGDWVAEGRDIGTVVAPDAELKVFLTGDPEERARRRARELGADWRTVLRDQALRDEQDRSRTHSPLRAAEDAVELDTTGLTVEEVVERVVVLVSESRSDAPSKS